MQESTEGAQSCIQDGDLRRQLLELHARFDRLEERYQSAVRTLQDIANMGRKVGCETAAHRLAMLGEKREWWPDSGAEKPRGE